MGFNLHIYVCRYINRSISDHIVYNMLKIKNMK